jgi:dTDP-4-dehydrorhamnose 3,5-epimerase
METFRASAFRDVGIDATFVQDNLVRSVRGALRGMHFQLPPAAQGKLVGVVTGRIFDVAVDVRKGSPTYGRWVGEELEGGTGTFLWIPPGFAHGYQVLGESAYVTYKVTGEYRGDLDRGFRWDDPDVGIAWPSVAPVVSERDQSLPLLRELETPFPG